MRRGGQPDLAAQQEAHVEFETDREQQQRDTEISQHVQLRHFLDVDRVEDEPGSQEPHQRRKAQRQRDAAQTERDDEIDRDDCRCHCAPLFGPASRRSLCARRVTTVQP